MGGLSPDASRSPAFRFPVPTGNWVLAGLAPFLVFLATASQRAYQTDFWHHLARGRVIVTEGKLLNEDRFTYTVHGEPLQDANWLTQVIYFHLFELGGLELVQLVNSLVLTAMMAGVVVLCWRFSGSLRLAALLSVVAFLGMWQVLIIRPQSFSFLLFVLLYLALDGSGRRPRLLLFPPLIMALWVNMHGGFPIGFLPIGCFLLAAAWDGAWASGWGVLRNGRAWVLALCLAASILATLVNPYGWKVYQYVLTISGVAAGRPISEWLPPGTYEIIGKVFIASILLVIVTFSLSRRRPTARDLFLVMCFLPLACGAMRMVAWWLIISLPIVAAQLAAVVPARWLVDPEGDRPSLPSGVFFGLLLVLAIGSIPVLPEPFALAGWVGRNQRFEDDLEKVAQELRQHPNAKEQLDQKLDTLGLFFMQQSPLGFVAASGYTLLPQKRVFCSLENSEYLGWALQPDGYTFFMDGRIEIIPNPTWADYWALLHARGDWPEILAPWNVNYLVLDDADPTQMVGLIPLVRKSNEWKEIGNWGKTILFARKKPTEEVK